jgi:glycosyltransferase involved in cell wall biosynthesis
LKILVIIQRLQLRGAEIFASQLARELQLAGNTVHVLYLFSSSVALRDQFTDLTFVSLNANEQNRFLDFPAYKRLRQIIANGDYDVVQANAGDTLKYCALSRMIYRWKTPLVYRVASKMSERMKSAVVRSFNRWLLRQCDRFVTVSNNSRTDLLQLFSPAKDRIDVISIGTYLFDDISPSVSRRSDEPVFIHIGSFVYEKNHKFLVNVFNAYFRKFKKGYLWLLGDGVLRTEVESQVKLLQLQDRIVFWGYRNDAIGMLKSADVFIMTSVLEGMPGVILEALSCKVPVITSAVAGIPEVVVNEVNGYCLTDLNEENFVTCMQSLAENSSIREKFKAAGRRRIEEEFLMPHIAKRFLKVYQTVKI